MKTACLNKFKTNDFAELMKLYSDIKGIIIARLREFEQIGKSGDDKELFGELAFCILTPQSNARFCWDAIVRLKESNVLFSNNENHIINHLDKVRFKYKKSQYIVDVRNTVYKNDSGFLRKTLSSILDTYEKREWLLKNIKGYGLKEASHFLRNIGYGDEVAILDRHILRNLVIFGVIDEIPVSISKNKYLEIENKMILYSREIQVPMSHLDLLFWYKEKSEVFK